MAEQGYQGWANYPTWAVALWLNNDQGMQECWADRAAVLARHEKGTAAQKREAARQPLADELARELGEEADSLLEGTGWIQELFQAGFEDVDWREIAQAVLEGADVDDDTEE